MNDTDLNPTCGCCEGVEVLTPLATAKRPGLNALAYRVGAHSSFLETMIARLSNLALELPAEREGEEAQTIYPLQALTTRQTSDPAIALLDAWATVADVLTFYQERIANEGYLRTAAERRSILELARLVGYKLRPGVAASVYLAFTLDNGYQVTIPAGSRSQSIPGPGELPQFFETAEPLPARAEWSELKPRLTRPQPLVPEEVEMMEVLYFQGISTNLKPNDPLLFVCGPGKDQQRLRRIEHAELQAADNRTKITLQPLPEWQQVAAVVVESKRIIGGLGTGPGTQMAGRVNQDLKQMQSELAAAKTMAEVARVLDKTSLSIKEEYSVAVDRQFSRLDPWVGSVMAGLMGIRAAIPGSQTTSVTMRPLVEKPGQAKGQVPALLGLAGYLAAAAKPASLQPANSWQLSRESDGAYAANADIAPRLLAALRPEIAPVLYQTWRELPLTPETAVQVLMLRTHAAVFGHNAPASDEAFSLQADIFSSGDHYGRWECTLRTEVVLQTGSHRDESVIREGESFRFFLSDETVIITIVALDWDYSIFDLNAFEISYLLERRFITINMKWQRGQTPEIQVFSSGGKHIVNITDTQEQSDSPTMSIGITGQVKQDSTTLNESEAADVVWLDTTCAQIVPGSWVVLVRPSAFGEPGDNAYIPQTVIAQVIEVSEQSRADYGLPGLKSTRLTLDRNWLNPEQDSLSVIRGTAVFAQSEPLTLAEAPIDPVAEAICGGEIELDRLYDGLEVGRWLIISGECTNVKPEKQESGPTRNGDEETAEHLPDIPATELVMLAGVEQDYDPTLPGETTNTRLLLANNLAYCYKRDTVTIYGNVAKATHGETRQEVLGSGNGSQPFQRFTLKQPPVTFVSAPTPSGVASSLVVRVNEIKWHEADHLVELEPADRKFTTQTDDEDKMTVIFGDGRYGARLPTGIENVKAVYRNGIGKGGNVAAGQISLLVTRPLGVKGVTNPLPASGGADRDSRDQARRNAPIAVTALDRLVSVSDYADFARTFAGIGKASAVRLADGRRQVVHLTIAGAGDIPIDKNSDLYRNLSQAVRQFGDPYQPVQIDIYRRKLLIISGKVRVLPDYLWEVVAPQIRAVLLDTFNFERRRLGQDVVLSEVISVVQAVRGVAYVDVDLLDGLDESLAHDPQALINALDVLAKPNKLDGEDGQPKERIVAKLAHIKPAAPDADEHIQPAELIYLSPEVPDTLILNPDGVVS
jgi:hypothetical protein